MNRSAVREFPASCAGVTPGAVLVATQLGDQALGGLPSPAAALVGALLERKGGRVSYAPVPHYDDPVHNDGGAVLFVATCQQRDGTMAAVAAVTAAADRVAAAAARSAVGEWSAVFDTRRLLAAPSPWCDGAQRALAMAGRAADGRRAVHVYGQLAGSPESVGEIASRGAVFISSLAEVPEGGTVIFPAHGVPAQARAEAAARGLEVIDATCPLVARTHAEARKLAGRGEDVVLIGQLAHPVVAGIAGAAPGRISVVATPAGTSGLQVTDSRRVSYLLQPGIPVEDSAGVTAALKSRFPALRSPHPDGFCYAASDRVGDDPGHGRGLRRDLRARLGGLTGHQAAVRAGPRPGRPGSDRQLTRRRRPGHAGRGDRGRPGGIDIGQPGAGGPADRGAVRPRPAERADQAGQQRDRRRPGPEFLSQ